MTTRIPYRQLFIDGQWKEPAKGKRIPIINPANEAVIGDIPAATAEDVEQAVEAARRAFSRNSGREWARASGAVRSKYLRAIAAKSECKTEVGEDDHRTQANSKFEVGGTDMEVKTRETKPLSSEDASCARHRLKVGGRVKLPQKHGPATLHLNRRRLSALLDRLVAAHCWRDASAVLSVLFEGNPRSYSPSEDRRNFLVAMELQKRFCREKNYHSLIKATYEIWMGKVSWHKKGRMKKKLLQLELALFYLTQGKFAEAHCYTKFLVSDESEQAPSINLIHGLVLYQLWYADLPEEMQIKGLDVQTSLDAHGMSSVDLCQESDKGESSNGHDAIDVEKSKGSSRCSSESSVGNEKLSTEQKNVIHRKKSGQPSHSQGFHAFQFFEDDELMGHPSDQDNVFDSSIYLAPGLDKILLPIHLKLLVEDPVQSVLLYRKLANENYREAVKHLHLALHSTPPLLAALLPLIQLLLLGDRVHEAIMELDYSCSVLDSALPFRLKARLLQCFHRDQITLISSCYQNALVRDPTCNYSMERLIKIHKSGNYSTLRLVEMLAMHLDAVDGKCGIWEELASCFLQLQRAMPSDYEDRVSTNVEAVKDISSCYRIPRIFIDGEAVDSWMIRCRWWASRHFCKRILLFEIQSGEQMLLQFKAACAAHLYGPNFEYVSAVVNSLQQQGNAEQISYLRLHIKNSLKLAENLLAS